LDSYTIQAEGWWDGRIHLEKDYPYLELAKYNNKIYLSFPPFPSVIMFLLVPFFGSATPSNLIVTLYAILSFVIIYFFCRRKKLANIDSVQWAAFVTFGGSLLPLSMNGAVWYQAQTLNFLLTILSIYLITSKKRANWYLSFVLWSFAIGCRPFQVIYFPVYVIFLIRNMRVYDNEIQTKRLSLEVFKFLIPPMLIGFIYLFYNYIRFDNPLEFGHNHLPIFIQSEYGQFHYKYILENLRNILRLPNLTDSLTLSFPKFNGFAFYIANPIFIVFFIHLILSIYKKYKLIDITVTCCFLLHLVLLLSHRTFGDWQFGTRFMVDLIPYCFLYISEKRLKYSKPIMILFAFGLILNTYGTLWLYLDWQ
jgi:hypothetical protein